MLPTIQLFRSAYGPLYNEKMSLNFNQYRELLCRSAHSALHR